MNSKEFEKCLQLKNFDKLEKEYQKTKSFFLDLPEKITCEEVSQRFPAFCFCKEQLRIKFPTYFIRIIDNQISYSDLKKLLIGQGKFSISVESDVMKFPSLIPVQSLAIHCHETSLQENEILAKKIESLLESRKIVSERCVSSGHFLIPITVDEDGYICI